MQHLLNRYERQADDAYMENLDSQRVSPANVPYLLTYLQRDEAGHMDPNATINALCEAIRTADEYAADAIRDAAADRDAIAEVAAQYQTENERLREQVTNAGLYLLSAEQGWTDASDRDDLRRLLPSLNISTPESRAILARTVQGWMNRAA